MAGPMTGYTKQSSPAAQIGLLRRFAPRNDNRRNDDRGANLFNLIENQDAVEERALW
jgi:hypothetical protein